MTGLFIPEITSEMFRNGSLESVEALMAEGEIYDIDYSPWIPVSEKLPEIDEDAVSKASVFEILGNLMSIPYDFDRPITERDVSESMDKIRDLPSVQTYTEAEIQKIQELEQAELEKAFRLGKAESEDMRYL